MRYALASSLVAVILATALILLQAVGRPSLGSPVGTAPVVSTAEPLGEVLGSEESPGWSHVGAPEDRTNRRILIERATNAAKSMGEQNPQLLDVTRLPADAALQAAGQDDFVGSPDMQGKTVHLTRMLGSFVPPRGPAGTAGEPRQGFMYIITEAETGNLLMRGFKPGAASSIPGP